MTGLVCEFSPDPPSGMAMGHLGPQQLQDPTPVTFLVKMDPPDTSLYPDGTLEGSCLSRPGEVTFSSFSPT